MTWTYDPLLSLNANLNIGKLGCIVRRYVRDAYGEMGGIYAGLSTDRFSVEWWFDSWRVKAHLDGTQRGELEAWLREYPVVNPALQMDGILKPSKVMTLPLPDARSCLIQIPADFQAVKQADFETAKAWRDQTRMLFEELFAWHYVIIGFAGRDGPDRLSSYYLLTREVDVEAMAKE
jgi:predicted GNAT superfamily acetyltransferase